MVFFPKILDFFLAITNIWKVLDFWLVVEILKIFRQDFLFVLGLFQNTTKYFMEKHFKKQIKKHKFKYKQSRKVN